MAMTNAERQKKYRNKNYYRINTQISSDANIDLQLLASRYAVTKRKMIEKLICEAKEKMIKKMSEEEIDALYESIE